MIAWLGKVLASELVQSEIKKLKDELLQGEIQKIKSYADDVVKKAEEAVGKAKTDIGNAQTFKNDLYQYVDRAMKECQNVGRDKWEDWWQKKRDELKSLFGQGQ